MDARSEIFAQGIRLATAQRIRRNLFGAIATLGVPTKQDGSNASGTARFGNRHNGVAGRRAVEVKDGPIHQVRYKRPRRCAHQLEPDDSTSLATSQSNTLCQEDQYLELHRLHTMETLAVSRIHVRLAIVDQEGTFSEGQYFSARSTINDSEMRGLRLPRIPIRTLSCSHDCIRVPNCAFILSVGGNTLASLC
jgi:hypothetical protein